MSEVGTVTSVDAFDLERYLGLWYEIGRLPLKYQDEESRDVTAQYSLNDDGSVRVDNRCIDGEGKPTQTLAKGSVVEGEVGQLTVNFLPKYLRWLPFTDGDYWVLRLTEDYSVSLVGTPDHAHLWLLARRHELPEAVVEEFLATAREQGFDLTDFTRTQQSGNRVEDGDVED
ncbi:lipocalin family protein [Nocardioides yefusunii]|uniref:Lipocalin family protein n=1 Tax=Nocardioides yefusunii TaxID=2500546 RepID=A0ABW1QRU9_9ACTN|nr:lipocalin family protein [Nocardioides yefusunii]